MPLRIFYSDRIEELAAHLKESLLEDRAAGDPFAFPQIVVPNANIAKWLRMRVFARTPALCAGVEFPFMEQRLSGLLARNLPDGERCSLLPDNAYANAIMATLLAPEHPEFDCFAPFRAYIAAGDGRGPLDPCTRNSARMAWQLSTTLADLMDQYEVRRPEIVENWLEGSGGPPPPGSVEAGEAALARALWGKCGEFPDSGDRLSLRQLYGRVKGSPPKGPPERIYFFGQSTLSLLQVKILAWLAETHEVLFYHNNVCLEYWGDIETKEERIRRLGRAHAAEEDVEVENPLLRQWGVAGRETMRLLVTLEEENDGRIDFEWECIADPTRRKGGTLLERLQESVCRRRGCAEAVRQDASLQIVGAPGVRREVEMVYNAIIGSVWKLEGTGERPWPDCSFSDVAVLVPDMSEYRPAIEAVFDARGDVPYGLVDTTASEDSMFLAGFLALADMARHGLSRETLFSVLENPCVQAALGFTRDDVAEWKETTAAIGAFDGFEAGEGESRFNWDWALSRLRLARVADAVRESAADGAESIPLAAAGGAGALRLSEIVELLFRRTEEAFGRTGSARRRRLPCAVRADEAVGREPPSWARTLVRLMNDFLAVPEDSPLEEAVRRQIILTLHGLDSIPGDRDCELALAAVEHFVGGISCRKGGYLTHGVTIAGLLPMRPVPFRQIYVLGLGEGGFPGRTGERGALDVRGAGWRLGDVTVPRQNRYLFLETLMSARDRLVITYRNRDMEKDAELFPAGIVRELEDFAGTLVEGGKFEEFKGYPLLERGERVRGSDAPSPVCDVEWRKDDPFAGILPTYSKSARSAAFPQNRNAVRRIRGRAAGDGASRIEIGARELADFLKSPFHAVLHRRFGVAEEGYRDKELDADSPLGIAEGPVKWGLQSAWLEGQGDIDGPFRELQLSGKAPAGFLGDFAKAGFASAVADAKERLLAFAKSFGGGKGAVRLSIPERIDLGGGRAVDVKYTAVVHGWREDGMETSALTTGYLKGADKAVFPPDRTLEPLIAFLMRTARRRPGAYSIRVGVIDVGNAAAAEWRWQVRPGEAMEYLKLLASRYLTYLERPQGDDKYADFTYRRLCEAVQASMDDEGNIAWEAALEDLGAEKHCGGGGFNRDLVVEQSVKRYCRLPTTEELRRLHDELYAIPLSGRKEPA